MPQIDTTIPVSANGMTAGQTVDFKGEVASSVVITNNSGFSIQYSAGGAFATVATGASASIGGVDPASFRIRKSALDASPGYPLVVGMSWVYGDDEVRVSGQAGVVGALNAGGPVSVPQVIAQSAIPFVMPSSGTVGTNGALSSLTAFNVAYGWCYCYFPAGAVFSGSVAGWYLTNLTGATLGTIYADTYTSGSPSIPANPTPIVAAGPGAYTQTTNIDIPGPSCVVPAGSMLENGALEWERATNNNNSAGQKIYNVYFGSQVLAGSTQTTNPYAGGWGTVKNRGSQQRQHALNSQNGDVGNAGGQKYLTIDTTQAQVMSHSIRLNTATDYAVIESFAFSIRPKF